MRAFSRSSSKSSVRNTAAYEALFDSYTEKGDDSDTIGPEGIERLCADMCVEPSDVTLLVMAWAMGAARMGYITRQEWMAAVPRLGGATTAPALQEELRTLHQALLRDIERFRDLHAFTHRFCREERRKTIDVASAVVMIDLLLSPTWHAHVPSLSAFLAGHKLLAQRGVLLDEWMMILQFVRQVRPDASNYGEDGAWPILLDEYVEWRRARDGTA